MVGCIGSDIADHLRSKNRETLVSDSIGTDTDSHSENSKLTIAIDVTRLSAPICVYLLQNHCLYLR